MNMNMEELRCYLKYLKDEDFEFHLDDDPNDMVWVTRQPTKGEFNYICLQHKRMWRSFASVQIWDMANEMWDIGPKI